MRGQVLGVDRRSGEGQIAGDDGRRSLEAGAIGAGLVGFLTVSLLDDPANAVRIAIAFWIMLGLAVTARGGRSRMRPDEPPTTRAARRALLDEERRRNTPVI